MDSWLQSIVTALLAAAIVIPGVWRLLNPYLKAKDATIESLQAQIDGLKLYTSPDLLGHMHEAKAQAEARAEQLTRENEEAEQELQRLTSELERKQEEMSLKTSELTDAQRREREKMLAAMEEQVAQAAKMAESLAGQRDRALKEWNRLREFAKLDSTLGIEEELYSREVDRAHGIERPWPGFFYVVPLRHRRHAFWKGDGPDRELVDETIREPAFPARSQYRTGAMHVLHPSWCAIHDSVLVWTGEPIVGLEPLNEEQVKHQAELRGLDYDEAVGLARRRKAKAKQLESQ